MPNFRMPAEWEPHVATWIAWPHHESDWPGKFATVDWVFAEIARVLSCSERVEILCQNEEVREHAKECLDANGVNAGSYRLHLVPNDRCWLRDSAPTAVCDEAGGVSWIAWKFNAWAKYDNYHSDKVVAAQVASLSGCRYTQALRPDNGEPLVLEGGAIDTDGQGTLLVTEECLLSSIQERNPGLSREGYELAFRNYLGIRKTIWLGEGCLGDDTHGHIDDIARFVAPGHVLLAYEEDPSDENHLKAKDNLRRLELATDACGNKLQITKLPMPESVVFDGERLPASYANFLITNRVVLVPTFNDKHDLEALQIVQSAFPGRIVVGIASRDLVLGQGTIHCLSQQQPMG